MSELLLELLSEEIPARMQARAAEDLKRLVVDGLKAQGLDVGEAQAYATPRRLALVVKGVPVKSPGVSEERKGPRVGAPDQAVAGFLKSAGLATLAEAEIVKDEKKGDYYVARIEKVGRPAAEIVADVVPQVLAKFPWPKSMRWGSGTFQWVRPLQSIVCLLSGKVVPFAVAGIESGNETRGHRFHGNTVLAVKSPLDYAEKLVAHKVILEAEKRAALITEQARALAKKAKLELVEDEALAAENAGLTEWPTVLIGTFEPEFLTVPAECLTTSMKSHQKCFSLKEAKSGKLANRFLLVTNLIASDGGEEIVAGNEKVIRARLSDAKFFWDQDLKRPLDEMAIELSGITFHDKLGSQKDRVERIEELAFQLAGACDAVPEDARRAAQLAKCDLVSGMVGEFPELQGLMGRYYAEKGGIKPEIARAIELHYKPKGPTDSVPLEEKGDAVACAVALADKLDTLVGFWAIGEKPTGSGDPYQLRRAALGVIRIVLENDFRVGLQATLRSHVSSTAERVLRDSCRRIEWSSVPSAGMLYSVFEKQSVFKAIFLRSSANNSDGSAQFSKGMGALRYLMENGSIQVSDPTNLNAFDAGEWERGCEAVAQDLLAFFADRLKVHLKEKGARHDLIDAVFALPGQDDLALIVKRVEALDAFLKTDDGATLLAGVKRASNILPIGEKKDKTKHAGEYDLKLLREKEELALAAAIESVKQDTVAAINVENFKGAMNALAELRAPVDHFFEKVTVNDADPMLRANRLRLLSEIRAATLNVADFSKIAG